MPQVQLASTILSQETKLKRYPNLLLVWMRPRFKSIVIETLNSYIGTITSENIWTLVQASLIYYSQFMGFEMLPYRKYHHIRILAGPSS